MTTGTPTDFNVAGERDPQLYAFMVRQLAEAIRRADDDRAPARPAGRRCGSPRHAQPLARGAPAQPRDRQGATARAGRRRTRSASSTRSTPTCTCCASTRCRAARRIPIGIWSTFANHGTVNPHTFTVYNADHHGAATRVAERDPRARAACRARQEVVNAYGNTDEGDMSAGLERRGPAWADEVGRREADAMLGAWRDGRAAA